MLNEIIKGISMKLNAAFGDGYRIYANDVEQGLQEPCFFVAVLKPELTHLPGGRYRKRNPFDIHYFPEQASNTELYAAAERMMDCLEFIILPDGEQLHGTNMNYETVDGVLHFFVNFDCVLLRLPDDVKMQTLTLDEHLT